MWKWKALTARDIVRTALEVEQTGMLAYQEMQSATTDPEMVKLLQYLAEDEAQHAAIFSEMFRDVDLNPETMPDPSPEDQAYIGTIMRSVVFEGPQAGIRRARAAKSPVEMLEMASQFERDAMLFWTKLYSLVRENDRPLVWKLIRQEEQHVTEVETMLAARRVASGDIRVGA
jgi:rubrerythrin